MWHFHMRGLVFDLQVCCGLHRPPLLPPSTLLSSSYWSLLDGRERSCGRSSDVATLVHPSSVFATVLHATVLPIIHVYLALHPSRTRMEQYRVDVGHVCMGVLALLPFATFERPIPAATASLIDGVVHAMEALLSALGVMAGPAPLVLALAGELDRDGVVFRGRPSVDGAHSVQQSVVSGDGMSVTLPPALLAWQTDFDVVCRSPWEAVAATGDGGDSGNGHHAGGDAAVPSAALVAAAAAVAVGSGDAVPAGSGASTVPSAAPTTVSAVLHGDAVPRFNPLVHNNMHNCVRSVTTAGRYDDMRSLQLYSWPRDVLYAPRLTREEVLLYLSRRHELCDWEYPPLTSDETAIRERLLRFKR